jgi:hypothetical protein
MLKSDAGLNPPLTCEGGIMTNETRHHQSSELLAGARWHKSSHSGYQGNCVEIAALPDGEFAIRNSRHPEGPALIFTRSEYAAFVRGAKDGEFDLLDR